MVRARRNVLLGPFHDCKVPSMYPAWHGCLVVWKCPTCKRKWKITVETMRQSAETTNYPSRRWRRKELKRRKL